MIANEVKELAQETPSATEDIARRVEAIQADTGAAVAEAAQGTGQIATNITGVSGAAHDTTRALGQTRTAVEALSRMAAELRSTVGRFTY